MSVSSREASIMVEDLHGARNQVAEWSQGSVDFLDGCRRTAANYPKWTPSAKQATWLAKLHVRFVDEDGIGAEILASARSAGD
jgi:hypothetical protein